MIKTSELAEQSGNYARVERAIAHLEAHYQDQPELDEVAEAAGLSAAHFQRMFKRWAGVSPRSFVQYLTMDHARRCLEESVSVLDASFEAGLSGPGRLHDLFVTYEAMTPGDYKSGGTGVEIAYGVHPSPFGPCFVGETERAYAPSALRRTVRWAYRSRISSGAGRTPSSAPTANARRRRRRVSSARRGAARGRLSLDLRGTNLHLKVWEALLRIPPGAVVFYDALAGLLDKPGAARDVGSAVAANPVSYLIPCHRVIRKSGRFHNYYWGPERKRAMLAWEAGHCAPAA